MDKDQMNQIMGIDSTTSNGENAGKPVENGDYDIVARCTGGKHRGRVGYVDDVASGKSAYIYFGTPCLSASAIVPYSKLVYATDAEIASYNEFVDSPEEKTRVMSHLREGMTYEQKFAEFIRMCETPDIDLIVVADPTALGDTYDEVIESLRRLQRANKTLAVAPAQ